jgi:hypothetical protein
LHHFIANNIYSGIPYSALLIIFRWLCSTWIQSIMEQKKYNDVQDTVLSKITLLLIPVSIDNFMKVTKKLPPLKK